MTTSYGFYVVSGGQVYIDSNVTIDRLSHNAIRIQTENASSEIKEFIDRVKAKGCGVKMSCGVWFVSGNIEQCDANSSTSSVQPSKCIALIKFSGGPVVTKPTIDLSNCKMPVYPADALKNGEAGKTRVQVLISKDGQIVDAKVASSSGFQDLDDAAKAAMILCKATPALVDNQPQQVWLAVDYLWTLPKANSAAQNVVPGHASSSE
jgi:protein TonB